MSKTLRWWWRSPIRGHTPNHWPPVVATPNPVYWWVNHTWPLWPIRCSGEKNTCYCMMSACRQWLMIIQLVWFHNRWQAAAFNHCANTRVYEINKLEKLLLSKQRHGEVVRRMSVALTRIKVVKEPKSITTDDTCQVKIAKKDKKIKPKKQNKTNKI